MDVFDSIIAKHDLEKFNRYVDLLASRLSDPKHSIPLSRSYAFPAKPGVYCLFENEKLIYIGETGSIKARMSDIFRTQNHSFRRSLGKRHFAHVADVASVSSKKLFPSDVEVLLTNYMEETIRVSFAPVAVGRAEVEEAVVEKYAPEFNVRGRRGSSKKIRIAAYAPAKGEQS